MPKNLDVFGNNFSAEDIQEQLPDESKLFILDKTWKILKDTHENPKIMAILENENPKEYLETFTKCNVTLDSIQKSLEDYLRLNGLHFHDSIFYQMMNCLKFYPRQGIHKPCSLT